MQQIKHLLFTLNILALSQILQQPAYASNVCAMLEADLKAQSKELAAYSEEHSKIHSTFVQKDIFCKKSGAALTTTIAKTAEALTCEAQKDANLLNIQMSDLGLDCHTTFNKVLNAHLMLEAEYLPLFNDVANANEILRKSTALKELCGRELKSSRELLENFMLLKTGIASSIVASREASGSYQKFERTARELAASTAARNKSCGLDSPLFKAAARQAPEVARGILVPVPVGRSARTVSTITGEIDDTNAESFFPGKIKAKGAGKSQTEGLGGGRGPASIVKENSRERSAGEAVFQSNAVSANGKDEDRLGLASEMATLVEARQVPTESSSSGSSEETRVFRPELVAESLGSGGPALMPKAIATSSPDVRYLGADEKGEGRFQRESITPMETRTLFAIVRHRYRVSVEGEMRIELPSRVAGLNR